MHWNTNECPRCSRVWIGLAGLVLACLFVAGPRLLAAWLHFWA